MKTKTWYQNLGFYSNPFSIKPAAFHDELFGYEDMLSKIESKLKAGSVIFLSGQYGSGKTTILKRVINRFKKKKKIIYYSCNQSNKTVDIDRLLYSRTFLRRLFHARQKNAILLLDEVQDINKKDSDKLCEYFDKGFFKSILLTSMRPNDVKFTDCLKELAKENIFKIGKLNKKQAIELVRKRIGNIEFLKDEIIEKIFSLNSNPRAFLKNCEELCRYAFEMEAGEVTEKHIKEVLR